jgi:hypothetical protein
MFSSENLISNSGFARAGRDEIPDWKFVADMRSEASWRRIAVPETDSSGLPCSAYAIELTTTRNGPGCLQRDIHLDPDFRRRFALRLAARASLGNPECEVVITFTEPAKGTHVVSRFRFLAAPGWTRFRTVFELDEPFREGTLQVQIHGPARAGDAACFTDVRLVHLFDQAESVAVRFDTRGDISLASSRLRAFMLEDYLHLIGCPATINRGYKFAVQICQKVRPWLKLLKAKYGRKAIVYDLDDNDLILSAGTALDIRWFARAVDGITVGSQFLRDVMTQWNPRTFVLENPVDILDRDVVHTGDVWRGRLVWFSMPENRWMLDRLALAIPVTTITRGGDIEYGLKSIDENLVTFDLALLPVTLNDETIAKNANRLVKCVGLGLPFLASDTAEHRLALQRLGLPETLLVASERDWSARIEDVARQYTLYKRLVDEARPRAFAAYGVERIVGDWLQFCSKLSREKETS